jgi:hypothetical protein
MGNFQIPIRIEVAICTAPSRSSRSVNRTWVLAPRVLFNTKEFE